MQSSNCHPGHPLARRPLTSCITKDFGFRRLQRTGFCNSRASFWRYFKCWGLQKPKKTRLRWRQLLLARLGTHQRGWLSSRGRCRKLQESISTPKARAKEKPKRQIVVRIPLACYFLTSAEPAFGVLGANLETTKNSRSVHYGDAARWLLYVPCARVRVNGPLGDPFKGPRMPIYSPYTPPIYLGSPHNTPHKLQGSLVRLPPRAPRENHFLPRITERAGYFVGLLVAHGQWNWKSTQRVQAPHLWGFGSQSRTVDGLLEVLGSKNRTVHGFGIPKPQVFSAWTLWLGCMRVNITPVVGPESQIA